MCTGYSQTCTVTHHTRCALCAAGHVQAFAVTDSQHRYVELVQTRLCPDRQTDRLADTQADRQAESIQSPAMLACTNSLNGKSTAQAHMNTHSRSVYACGVKAVSPCSGPNKHKLSELHISSSRISIHLQYAAMLVALAKRSRLLWPHSCGTGHHLCLTAATAGRFHTNVLYDNLQAAQLLGGNFNRGPN